MLVDTIRMQDFFFFFYSIVLLSTMPWGGIKIGFQVIIKNFIADSQWCPGDSTVLTAACLSMGEKCDYEKLFSSVLGVRVLVNEPFNQG